MHRVAVVGRLPMAHVVAVYQVEHARFSLHGRQVRVFPVDRQERGAARAQIAVARVNVFTLKGAK